MRNIHKIARLVAMAPLLVLAGCGGEPSESDMREAFQAQIDQANGVAGGRNVLTLHEFKKLGCAKVDGSSAYACTVTMRFEGPLVNNSGTTEMRFTKGDSGWVVVQ